MTLIEQIKAAQLTARKNRDAAAAASLTTLIGEAEMIGKNANRVVHDLEVVGILKKFIDNIDFTTSAVPEPASVALLLAGLAVVGAAGRARSKAKVVGVTGSVGKTSTKEMLRAILGGQGRVHAAEASYNNHWGVPLTLARMPQYAQFAVIPVFVALIHAVYVAPLVSVVNGADVPFQKYFAIFLYSFY